MKKYILIFLLLPLTLFAQQSVNIIQMKTATTPFAVPYLAGRYFIIMSDSVLYQLTHDVTSAQSMQTVFNNKWYKIITDPRKRDIKDHDSLSKLDEKSYNSLTEKPIIPDVSGKVNTADSTSPNWKYVTPSQLSDLIPDISGKKDKSDSTAASGYATQYDISGLALQDSTLWRRLIYPGKNFGRYFMRYPADTMFLSMRMSSNGMLWIHPKNYSVLPYGKNNMAQLNIGSTAGGGVGVGIHQQSGGLYSSDTMDIAVTIGDKGFSYLPPMAFNGNVINDHYELGEDGVHFLLKKYSSVFGDDSTIYTQYLFNEDGFFATSHNTLRNYYKHPNIGTLTYPIGTGYFDHITLNGSPLVSFPGFGTDHATTAYGDHNHSGTYQPAGTYVNSVSSTSPIVSSGGTTPAISINADSLTSWRSKQNQGVTAFNWGNHVGLYPLKADSNKTSAGNYITRKFYFDNLYNLRLTSLQLYAGGWISIPGVGQSSSFDSIYVKDHDSQLMKTAAKTHFAAASHNHSLSNITGLQDSLTNHYTKAQADALLSAKQATLVSGTNIKTINGSSVLGSGDLTVSSGYDSTFFTLAGSYASASTFTVTGTQNTADKMWKSLIRWESSAGAIRYGVIEQALYSAGTITATVWGTAAMAANDKNYRYAPRLKAREWERRISIPGYLVTDASNPVGMWYEGDAYDTLAVFNVSAWVLTAAAGTGSPVTQFNLYYGSTALFNTGPDMGTNTSLLNQTPNTYLVPPSQNMTLRILSATGSTNTAADFQCRFYAVPTRLYWGR